jgi:hypothetical protein
MSMLASREVIEINRTRRVATAHRDFLCGIASVIFLAACSPDQPTVASGPHPHAPARLRLTGGGQITIAGALFSAPMAIVTDSAGVGVPGVTVTFRATGSGSVDPAQTKTGPDGVVRVSWLAGLGENALTASVPGLADTTVVSHGMDTSGATPYELTSIAPSYVINLNSTLLLTDGPARGFFYTTVQCVAPATCRDSGWGTYTRSDSTLTLTYANNFWDIDGFEHREFGVFRGDTLLIKRPDAMWSPYLFTLTFVCHDSQKSACK